MSERSEIDKKELLAKNERAWLALNEALIRLDPQELTGIYDAQGWAVKDHLFHLAAWERSMIYFLQGKPRYEGLGVDETTYLTGGYEAINAVIQQQNRKMSLTEVMEQLQTTHLQLTGMIQKLTDVELRQPYRHYLPDEPGEGDGPPAIDLLLGNMAYHFEEHMRWIKALLAGEG